MSSIRVSIDLSRTSRDDLDVRLHELEVSARQTLGGDVEVSYRRTSDRHFEVKFILAGSAPAAAEPLVLTSEPLNTDTLQGLAQFDRTLAKSVTQINEEISTMSNITGATFLSAKLRADLAAVKGKIADAGQKMNDALVNLSDTASQANQMADQVVAETADLQAALGLHSNNPPPGQE